MLLSRAKALTLGQIVRTNAFEAILRVRYLVSNARSLGTNAAQVPYHGMAHDLDNIGKTTIIDQPCHGGGCSRKFLRRAQYLTPKNDIEESITRPQELIP